MLAREQSKLFWAQPQWIASAEWGVGSGELNFRRVFLTFQWEQHVPTQALGARASAVHLTAPFGRSPEHFRFLAPLYCRPRWAVDPLYGNSLGNVANGPNFPMVNICCQLTDNCDLLTHCNDLNPSNNFRTTLPSIATLSPLPKRTISELALPSAHPFPTVRGSTRFRKLRSGTAIEWAFSAILFPIDVLPRTQKLTLFAPRSPLFL